MNLFERTKTKDLIAITVITFGLTASTFANLSDTVNNRIFDLMFLVGAYYFGSSSSASKKDEAINNLSKTVNNTTS